MKGRAVRIPCNETAPTAEVIWQKDLTPHPIHTTAVSKAMRRAHREGITVRMVEDFSDWHHSAGCLWHWQFPAKGESGEIYWQYALGHWAHFVAECDGQVVGTLGCYWWDGVATEVMSSIRPSARGLQVQEPLHVAVMDYARQLGCHTFDLGGEGTPGIGNFKSKFGGTKTWVASAKL